MEEYHVIRMSAFGEFRPQSDACTIGSNSVRRLHLLDDAAQDYCSVFNAASILVNNARPFAAYCTAMLVCISATSPEVCK